MRAHSWPLSPMIFHILASSQCEPAFAQAFAQVLAELCSLSSLELSLAMPVPWPQDALKATRIDDVENRAMTLQQLRDLRIMLQRLCKAGLLKSYFYCTEGILIHWFDINMYHISDLVIKPVIEFIEKKRGTEERTIPENLVSTSYPYVMTKPKKFGAV